MRWFENENVRGKYLTPVDNSLCHRPTSVESERTALAAGKTYKKIYSWVNNDITDALRCLRSHFFKSSNNIFHYQKIYPICIYKVIYSNMLKSLFHLYISIFYDFFIFGSI